MYNQMNLKKYIVFICLVGQFVMSVNASANSSKAQIKKMVWNGIDVVFIADNRNPTYDVSIYFGDGAAADQTGADQVPGATTAAFDLLKSGTNTYTQKEISEFLDFFGASQGAVVTHEYALYNVSGLTKDAIPTMKMVCHLFNNAQYPQAEIEKYKKQAKQSLLNIVNQHASLAAHIFREVSLRGTPFSYPSDGKLKDIERLSTQVLLSKKEQLNKVVKKKIYITGPKSILAIKDVIINDCHWSGEAKKKRSWDKTEQASWTKGRKGKGVFFVEVPGANQVQVRWGRWIEGAKLKTNAFSELLSSVLGGGFTSLLMQELRVKRGLTYSAGAVVGGQKFYGRSMISTFTKNETITDLLNVIWKSLRELEEGTYQKDYFTLSKK